VSVSIAILKVLSAYPGGRAHLAELKADLAILSSPDWNARIRRLAKRAGPINLFSSKLITSDQSGWTITATGREFLERIERAEEAAPAQPKRPVLSVVSSQTIVPQSKPTNRSALRAVGAS